MPPKRAKGAMAMAKDVSKHDAKRAQKKKQNTEGADDEDDDDEQDDEDDQDEPSPSHSEIERSAASTAKKDRLEKLLQHEELTARQLEQQIAKAQKANRERNRKFAEVQNASRRDDGTESDSPSQKKKSKTDKTHMKKKTADSEDKSDDEEALRVNKIISFSL
jgi:hypothetical protein